MKVRNKNEVITEARNEGRIVYFASFMDLCHLKKSELEPQHQKYKGRVVLLGDTVKDDSRSYAVFTGHGSSASQVTLGKVVDVVSRLPGCAGQAADTVSANTQVKMEDAPKIIENSKIGISRHLDSSTKTQMAKIMVRYGRPSSLRRNLHRHPLAGLLWERQFEKVLLKYGWEKVPNCECLFVNRGKGLFLAVYVDERKTGWKETTCWPNVGSTHERRWFGRTDIIPWPCSFGLYSNRISNEQRYCRQLPKYVRIQDLCQSYGKTTSFREIGCEYFLMVLWHGRSCKEVCGTILRTGVQNNSTATQRRNTLSWPPPISRRRNRISWRIIHSLLTNCFFWNVYTWLVLVDLIFHGP